MGDEFKRCREREIETGNSARIGIYHRVNRHDGHFAPSLASSWVVGNPSVLKNKPLIG